MIVKHFKQCSLEVIGTDHVQSGLPCQDKTAYANGNGVRVIVLSDGAGSKKNSDLGAEIATKTIAKLVMENFDDYYLLLENEPIKKNKLAKILVHEVYQNLNKAASEQENLSIMEMSCTVLFVAIKEDKYIQGHIGDGLIGELITNEQGLEVRIRSYPENNGAPNITFFITDSDAIDHFRITSGTMPSNVKGYVLMSDGPEEVLYDPVKKTINQYIQNLFGMYKGAAFNTYKKTLERFLSEQISKYSYDDLSMNFLYVENEPIKFYQEKGPEYISHLIDKINTGARVLKTSSYAYVIDDSFNEPNFSDDDKRQLLRYFREY
jgi:serine/threonine protein phosphatase PrpC